MNALALFICRLKASLRDIASMAILFLCVAGALMAHWHDAQRQQGLLTLALVNEDRGGMGARLAAMLSAEETLLIRTMDRDAADRFLLRDMAQCSALIPADFTERLQRREFRDLAVLTVSSGSAYAAMVSEPLVNAIMKLWFEQLTSYNVDAFLLEQGLALTPEQKRALEADTERIWREGALIRVENVAPNSPGEDASEPVNIALCWYAALVPFYFMVNSGWMLQDNFRSLVRRIRHTGFSTPLLFLAQSAAGFALVAGGFILVGLLSMSSGAFLALLPQILLYCIGCAGMALALCSLCRSFAALLIIAPTFTLAAAALSGLLMPLPEWADVWAIISGVLPGRSLYEAFAGAPGAPLAAGIWLGAGLLLASRDRLIPGH